MADRDTIEKDMERQIAEAHERFVDAMTARVPRMSLEQKERYLAALSSLATRVADVDKPLRQVAQESFAEIAPFLLAEMQGR